MCGSSQRKLNILTMSTFKITCVLTLVLALCIDSGLLHFFHLQQTCIAKPSRISHFTEITLVETRFLCYQLIVVDSITRTWTMNIWVKNCWFLAFSWIFKAIFGKPLLVAHQNSWGLADMSDIRICNKNSHLYLWIPF